jgi:hypothetical protein
LPFNKIVRIKLRRRSHVVNVWHRIMDRWRGVSVRGRNESNLCVVVSSTDLP